MFQEFVNRSGIPVRGMPWGLRKLAEWFVVPLARIFPTLFFLFVLGGEDPVDHIQRRVLSDAEDQAPPVGGADHADPHHRGGPAPLLRPALHAPNRAEAGAFRRLHLTIISPLVLGIMARLMLWPTGDLVRHYNVPRSVVRSANGSAESRQLLKDSVAKTRKLFVELGLITPVSKLLWKGVGLWDSKK